MTATTLPAEKAIPPFGIYRATTAHWSDGTIKLLYSKLKGQGRLVLVEELPGEDPVELGHKYQLTLVRIEDGEPVPPIEMPTFPVLPKPPIAEVPPEGVTPEKPLKPETPIYKPPTEAEPPIAELPPEGVTPEVPPYDPQPK